MGWVSGLNMNNGRKAKYEHGPLKIGEPGHPVRNYRPARLTEDEQRIVAWLTLGASLQAAAQLCDASLCDAERWARNHPAFAARIPKV